MSRFSRQLMDNDPVKTRVLISNEHRLLRHFYSVGLSVHDRNYLTYLYQLQHIYDELDICLLKQPGCKLLATVYQELLNSNLLMSHHFERTINGIAAPEELTREPIESTQQLVETISKVQGHALLGDVMCLYVSQVIVRYQRVASIQRENKLRDNAPALPLPAPAVLAGLNGSQVLHLREGLFKVIDQVPLRYQSAVEERFQQCLTQLVKVYNGVQTHVERPQKSKAEINRPKTSSSLQWLLPTIAVALVGIALFRWIGSTKSVSSVVVPKASV